MVGGPLTWQELVKDPDLASTVPHNDPRLDDFTAVVEKHYGLPEGLLLSVKNAGERSNTGQVSPAGAKGVMQFIDSTREQYPHDPNDPFASIDAAGRYFVDLLQRYNGNVRAALTEYNGGTKQAAKVVDGGDPWADETINYLARIKKYMQGQAGGSK